MRGRLITAEGVTVRGVQTATWRLLAQLRTQGTDGGVSRWDASGIFSELRAASPGFTATTPRALVLLYAADLAFRLKQEILPALEEGTTLVAAPYVETAIAFGKAAGLPKHWLIRVFRFAPRADACHRIPEDVEDGGDGHADGFFEFSVRALVGSGPTTAGLELRQRALAYLESHERLARLRVLPPSS